MSENQAVRCTFVGADGGVFHRCETVPAPGHDLCSEHEDKMARMMAGVRSRLDIHADLAKGKLTVEEHADKLRAIHEWERKGGMLA